MGPVGVTLQHCVPPGSVLGLLLEQAPRWGPNLTSPAHCMHFPHLLRPPQASLQAEQQPLGHPSKAS